VSLFDFAETLDRADAGSVNLKGNAKVLNAETHNDLLDETHMTNAQYL